MVYMGMGEYQVIFKIESQQNDIEYQVRIPTKAPTNGKTFGFRLTAITWGFQLYSESLFTFIELCGN